MQPLTRLEARAYLSRIPIEELRELVRTDARGPEIVHRAKNGCTYETRVDYASELLWRAQ